MLACSPARLLAARCSLLTAHCPLLTELNYCITALLVSLPHTPHIDLVTLEHVLVQSTCKKPSRFTSHSMIIELVHCIILIVHYILIQLYNSLLMNGTRTLNNLPYADAKLKLVGADALAHVFALRCAV